MPDQETPEGFRDKIAIPYLRDRYGDAAEPFIRQHDGPLRQFCAAVLSNQYNSAEEAFDFLDKMIHKVIDGEAEESPCRP